MLLMLLAPGEVTPVDPSNPSRWVRGRITGDDWSYVGAPFPWRPFGLDANLVFSWDSADFPAMAGTGLTIKTATVVLHEGLQQVGTTSITSGVINARIKRSAVEVKHGTMMPVRVHITLSDDQHDDRTFLLRSQPR